MTTIDQQTTDPATTGANELWDRHLTAAQTRYESAAAEYTDALADLLALVTGRPRPSDVPTQLFATDVEVGDQIQWQDGWWYITGTDEGNDVADVVLTASRVGYEAIELEFGGDVLLTTVRCSP